MLRRQSRGRLEDAMEIAGAATDGLGEIVQAWLLLTLLDQTARLRNDSGIFGFDRKAVRMAALARAEAGRLRGFERIVQSDVLRFRGPRRTRRATINPRRRDRIPEMAIRGSIAGDDTRPAQVIG